MTEKTTLQEWQKEFKIKELTEADVERVEEIIFENDEKLERPNSNVKHGFMLRCAIRAGWIESPACEVKEVDEKRVCYYGDKSVEDLHPGAVRWLGLQVATAYGEAQQIPKNL
jgi:hypothetical protein